MICKDVITRVNYLIPSKKQCWFSLHTASIYKKHYLIILTAAPFAMKNNLGSNFTEHAILF